MPELPEVETICRALRDGGRNAPSILGCRVEQVQVRWAKTIAQPLVEEFNQRILGQKIVEVSRRGKFIVIHLSHQFMVVHLRMSGDLRVDINQKEPIKHDHLILGFNNGMHLAFNDARKFGRVWLLDNPDSLFEKIGPEPFDFPTSEAFFLHIRNHKRQLKPLLMDQKFMAGLGNIYTDEALHISNLHPLTIAATLSFDQAEILLEAIRSVLCLGIERNGASIDWFYRGGSFQNEFQVYGRKGLPCLNCGTLINKIVVGQRGTHYCPNCQPFPLTQHKTKR